MKKFLSIVIDCALDIPYELWIYYEVVPMRFFMHNLVVHACMHVCMHICSG